ncbi:unnamed protein product [Closterium sp. Yama58-4]|nr:unnamed protein product [Closterium sp. Yama58-4]
MPRFPVACYHLTVAKQTQEPNHFKKQQSAKPSFIPFASSCHPAVGFPSLPCHRLSLLSRRRLFLSPRGRLPPIPSSPLPLTRRRLSLLPATASPSHSVVSSPLNPAVASPHIPPSPPPHIPPSPPPYIPPSLPPISRLTSPWHPAVASLRIPPSPPPSHPAVASPSHRAVASPSNPAVASLRIPPSPPPSHPAVASPSHRAVASPSNPAVASPLTAVASPSHLAVAADDSCTSASWRASTRWFLRRRYYEVRLPIPVFFSSFPPLKFAHFLTFFVASVCRLVSVGCTIY